MELNRFKQLLESTMGNVKPLIMEQPTGDSSTQKIKLIDTNWEELPQSLQNREGTFGYLGSGDTLKNSVTGITEFIDTNNLGNTGLCKISEGDTIYLLKISGNPVPSRRNCQIDMGTVDDYKQSYSTYTQWVQTLPEGTSKYLVLYVKGDPERSILGVKKNDGKTCFTWLQPSPGYPPFKDCV